METKLVLDYGFAINFSRRETFVQHPSCKLPAAFQKKKRKKMKEKDIVVLSVLRSSGIASGI